MNIFFLSVFLFLLIINYSLSTKIDNNNCRCAIQNLSHNIYNINLNTKYSTEWWYILINYIDIDSPIISQEIIWLRHGKYCNGSSIYFYQESVLYRNKTLHNHLEFEIKTDYPKESFIRVNNHTLYFGRKNSYNLNHFGINNNISMSGYGYPQGFYRDGFVRTGKYQCDTSYTLSFPKLNITFDKYSGNWLWRTCVDVNRQNKFTLYRMELSLFS